MGSFLFILFVLVVFLLSFLLAIRIAELSKKQMTSEEKMKTFEEEISKLKDKI